MTIPNADKAVIPEDKLRNYLLNLAHGRGGSKAKLLLSTSYQAEDLQHLEADLRLQHLPAEVDCESDTEYGRRYEIVGSLHGPAGRGVVFRSIWQIDSGTQNPRLITMYPE